MSRNSTAQQAARPQQQSAPQIDPETPLLDAMMFAQVSRLEKASNGISKQLEDPAVSRMQHSLLKGLAISRLKAMITPQIRGILMSLMNTKHGFKTDHGPKVKSNPTPYPEDVVIDCAIAALLDGVLWAGNHFNIIAGECYITGEGWEYKLKNLSGFSDLHPYPGTPIAHNGQTCVRFGASWKFNGVRDELKDAEGKPGVVFAIKTDAYSGPDQIVGKARAKAYKLIYKTLTSSNQTVSADEPIDIITSAESANDLRGVISDAQEAELNDAIESHEASALLIRTHYGLSAGQRLLAAEFSACMKKIAAGDFSAPPERSVPTTKPDGEIEDEEPGDLAEFSADEVDAALKGSGVDPWTTYKRFGGKKRAADLSQDERRAVMSELAHTVS